MPTLSNAGTHNEKVLQPAGILQKATVCRVPPISKPPQIIKKLC